MLQYIACSLHQGYRPKGWCMHDFLKLLLSGKSAYVCVRVRACVVRACVCACMCVSLRPLITIFCIYFTTMIYPWL